VRSLSKRLDDALAAIDAANAEDPTVIVVRGEATPLALAQGRLAMEWAQRLASSPDEALLLAARAHHLRRWELPRESYPQGRAAYLRWRKDQKSRHARDVEVILREVGYDTDVVARVQALIRRDGLGTAKLSSGNDAQVVEDAACLVFIETQLASMAQRIDRDRLLEVIRKTARKMSAFGLDALEQLSLGEFERGLIADALSEHT